MLIVEANFRYEHKEIIWNSEEGKNLINILGVDYYIYKLNDAFRKSKGSNSFVFKLVEAQSEYVIDSEKPCKAIKVSNKYELKKNNSLSMRNNGRFKSEIEALEQCKQKHIQNIIEIDCSGYIKCIETYENVPGQQQERDLYFPFYMMDYALYDLKSYLERIELDEYGKILLCSQLAKGLDELNSLGFYHRDIKPDNILFFEDGTWRIGDLGLVARRNIDFDKRNEWIGPRGWMSPESMNKFLAEGVEGRNFDCSIDHQSDIFQMGKVFWYILQGNAPIGCVVKDDFISKNTPMYILIKNMLHHSKKRRITTMKEVVKELDSILNGKP